MSMIALTCAYSCENFGPFVNLSHHSLYIVHHQIKNIESIVLRVERLGNNAQVSRFFIWCHIFFEGYSSGGVTLMNFEFS